MTSPLMRAGVVLLLATTAATARPAPPASIPASRVEARSNDLLAVGLLQEQRMVIHLSRLIDNAPVHDAVLTVALRGEMHPTIAEADGSYSLTSNDLMLPGSATLVFQVARGGVIEELRGTLDVTANAPREDKNSARQLGWWVLNFAVCIGFLMLISRRRKAAAARD